MIEPKKLFSEILQKHTPQTSTTNEGREVHSVTWKIPSHLPYFDGHFPQSPIFPAVGILDASTVILRMALEPQEFKLKAVISAKFLSPITPNTSVQIEWQTTEPGEWQVDWKESDSSRLLATMQLQA